MQDWEMTLMPKPQKLIFNSKKKTKKTKTMNGTNRSTVSHFSDTGSLKPSSKEHIFRLPGHAQQTHWVHVGTLSRDHNVNAIVLISTGAKMITC